ncbi:MalY/PatB family protein [Streptomyces purpureus]|uniref:cysteine-S-conjugate beta-lyase n=1 Tax=Streptomyces purpureus TaxID=1951 RepID=A0A918GWP4_9ACTN|nr:aminotransferase class I/II-fold pyridoxal phosphate-dependent enzyme [Streptomyces purpureus]GGT16036.1 aminotransferase [Streptomyces purpureus]
MSLDHPPPLDLAALSGGLPSTDGPQPLLSAKYPSAIGAWVAEMAYAVARPIHTALEREMGAGTLGYNDPVSIGRARESVVRRMGDTYGWTVRPESIGFVSDIVTGFGAVLRHFLPQASTIVVPTPAYTPFLTVPRLFGHQVAEVPGLIGETGHRMDLAGIEAALSRGARMVVLCNPHNPTGRVFSAEELSDLVALVDAYGARVFSDEVHAPLTLTDAPHLPYAGLGEIAAGHTITATSASKGWNTAGLKCAQLIFSAPADLRLWQGIADFYLRSVSRLGVAALCAAYDEPESQQWLTTVRDRLARNNALVGETLAERLPQVLPYPAEATYLAWLDCRRLGVDEPAAFFREHAGLAMSDGTEFSAPGHLRLNFALPEGVLHRALSALVRGADLLQSGKR